jgi:DNA-3-methyladenine glycosylase
MTAFRPLPRDFYSPSAESVAPRLLGHWLIRTLPDGCCGGPIVEVEAYLEDDPACHAAPGLTKRNRTMFGPPGHGYVYLIYGFHYCVNAVCKPAGTAEAVLIRAIEPLFGRHLFRANRTGPKLRDLTNGPAKLCEAMGIDRSVDGVDLCQPGSPLIIAKNPAADRLRRQHGPLITTTRIGITRAASLPLRFYLGGNPFVSQRG